MKLDDAKLLQIVPYSIAKDETVQNVAKSLDAPTNDVTGNIRNILILSRIDELPEEILDALAWEYHVDTYDTEYSVNRKRALVGEAIKDHRYKGTPYALKTALSIIADAELEEWYQYDAAPYHFRIHLQRMPASAAEYRKVDSICRLTKNVRSWCDGVQCDVALDWPIYVGGAKEIKTAITIYPAGTDGEPMGNTWYTGIAGKTTEWLELYQKD